MLLFYKNRTFKCNTNNVYGNIYIINDMLLYDIHTYNMYTDNTDIHVYTVICMLFIIYTSSILII